MEEKRKDTGALPALNFAAATATVTPPKPSEPPAAAAEPPSSRRRVHKRKGNNSSGNTSTSQSASSKRQAREKLSAVPFPPIHNGPCTRARQSPNTSAAVAATLSASFAASSASAVKSETGLAALQGARVGEAWKAENEDSKKEDLEALEAKIEAEFEAMRSRGANAHVVPVPCGWFSWTKVHPLEEQALPTFFNGKSESRTPEIYMEIRNWIMKKFHTNPNMQIELKDLSEMSVGELDARQEVMEFLDYWGLINYRPFLVSDSAMENAEDCGTAQTDSLLGQLYRFEVEQPFSTAVPGPNVVPPAVPSGLLPESAIAEDLTRPEGPAVEYHCNSCSADCSRKRYHCQKQADFDLCSECFNNGKFGSDMLASDFILMEPAEVPGVSGGKWTDQETLLLLEALELYKENWNEIAEHVATKTKTQCILHFVQMPIEDTFLDCDDEIDASAKENSDPASTKNEIPTPNDVPETTEEKTSASEIQPISSPMETSKPEDVDELKVGKETTENFALRALREAFEAVGSRATPGEKLSFSEVGNPVMALASFLVHMVEQNVATASVYNSLKSISGKSSGMELSARHCFLLEDPPEGKTESPADNESALAESVGQDAQNIENQSDETRKEGKSNPAINGGDPNKARSENPVEEDRQVLVSPTGDCTDKPETAKEIDTVSTHDQVERDSLNESDKPDVEDQAPSNMEEPDNLTSKADLPANPAKDSGGTSVQESLQCAEAPINDDIIPDTLPLEKQEPANSVTSKPDSLPLEKKEPENPVTSKPDSLPLEKKDTENPVTSNSMVDSGAKTGEEDAKGCKNTNEDPLETKTDLNFNKLKRAAVTAISAAAVKAKLLANQEEDQIKQLASLLIEKQLHKLETKLAFFNDMESIVMRVREQMEKSRQRLYHERAQIIAARLGLPASSSRPMQQPSPINRAAMNFANSAPKPPMSMTSQRPPIPRPVTSSLPPTSNPFVPATVAGNSVRPSNQDKLSPVGTK